MIELPKFKLKWKIVNILQGSNSEPPFTKLFNLSKPGKILLRL